MGGVVPEIATPEQIVDTQMFDRGLDRRRNARHAGAHRERRQDHADETVLYASKEARDGALATGMTDGMEMGFARLDALLTEGGG